MNSEFSLLGRTLTLHRWPVAQKNRTLQAWDSSDEYLIDAVEAMAPVASKRRILLLNDNFGALSCWFAHWQPISLVDSFVSRQATLANFDGNHLPLEQLTLLNSMDDLPAEVDLVLLKLPKNNGYLEFLLAQISRFLPQGTQIIAGGKTTDVHSSTLKIFERFIGPTTTSLAKKKSRLIHATLSLKPQQCDYPRHWQLDGSEFTVVNHANVFSRDSLDIGARLLLAHLPPHTSGLSVVDLGCGNGVIGLSILAQAPDTRVTFVDESYMAVASAQATVAFNLPQCLDHCQFVVDDCLTGHLTGSADWVVCNPPFHQQQAVTDHIAWQMFKDALRVLKPGGQLLIVGNRNLDYAVKLKRLFGHTQTVASNSKFTVLTATKSTTKSTIPKSN